MKPWNYLLIILLRYNWLLTKFQKAENLLLTKMVILLMFVLVHTFPPPKELRQWKFWRIHPHIGSVKQLMIVCKESMVSLSHQKRNLMNTFTLWRKLQRETIEILENIKISLISICYLLDLDSSIHMVLRSITSSSTLWE